MRRGIAVVLALGIATLLTASPAQAVFHLVKIREVAPNPAGAQTAFIELQAYAPGQTQLAGHSIAVYNAVGGAASVPFGLSQAGNGEAQRTYLIGDDLTAGSPDFINQQLQSFLGPLGPGGAVCFDTVDCVAWGNFSGVGLPSPPGTPAPAIPDGSSLTRTIAPGCATLLEDADDTNQSAADFSVAAPTPQSNGTAPAETPCTSGDADPPQTTITKKPKKKSTKRKVKIKFESNETGSDFGCRLDGGAFEDCSSPFKAKVDLGKHKFQVYAVDRAGNADPTPAKAKFKRVKG